MKALEPIVERVDTPLETLKELPYDHLIGKFL